MSMPQRFHPFVAVFLGLLLTACAATSSGPGAPYYGTEFVLARSLSVEVGWARAFVQHGAPVGYGDIAKFDPYCSVEVRTLVKEGMSVRIEPGTFAVTRIQRQHPPGGVFAGILDPDEDFGPVMLEIDLYLDSPEQPDVLRLRCNRLDPDPAFARPIGPLEIREVLGEVGSLN